MHKTKDLNDGYVGSGKLLRRAIKKYGADNFVTEILEVYDNEHHMKLAEKIYVVIDPMSYNLCPGGHGGFGYINDHGLAVQNFTKENGKSFSIKANNAKKEKWNNDSEWRKKELTHLKNIGGTGSGFLGKKHSEATKEKMRKSKENYIPWNKGKKHSEETKLKISESVRRNLHGWL